MQYVIKNVFFLFQWFLLATAMDVLSTHRSKRDLKSIKNLISSNLFGTETIVIQIPKIPKNETFQMFKIKGYDDILLKVVRKPQEEKDKLAVEETKDLVMVSPEIAIIGKYLGTTTQVETLLALDIAKNLLKSGILSSERVLKVQKPGNVITSERDPIYILPDSADKIELVNSRPIAVYPAKYQPIVVTSKVKYRPLQTKYSYKQEGEHADMMYESYNNHDVIVTRTDKVPDKPSYIALRLAEAVSIGANPYVIRSHQPITMVTPDLGIWKHLKVEPSSITSQILQKIPPKLSNTEELEKVGNAVSNHANDDVPNFIKQSKSPFDIRDHLSSLEIDKLNQYINAKLGNHKIDGPTSDNVKDASNENTRSDYIQAATMYGDMVHRYVYHQMGDDNQRNYTIVRIEDPKLNQTNLDKEKSLQKYVYVPPLNIDIPPVPIVNSFTHENANIKENNGLSSTLEPIRSTNGADKMIITSAPTTLVVDNNVNNYLSSITPIRTKYNVADGSTTVLSKPKERLEILGLQASNDKIHDQTGTLKTNIPNSLKSNPIVVADISRNRSQGRVRTHQRGPKSTNTRPFNGGPVF